MRTGSGIGALALLLSSTALYAADMPVKAVPLPASYSWAGAYAGLNAGGVQDHMGLGAVPLSFPGVIVSDPNGAVLGVPSFILGIPGSFPTPVATNESTKGSFIGGGQVGYNFQHGNIVYGLEGDVDVLRSQKTVSGITAFTIPGVATAPPGAGLIARSTAANFTIDRNWQASIRGRVGYAWDRFLVYATGGIAGTSVTSNGNFVFTTTLGPGLTPLLAIPNFAAAGQGAAQDFYGRPSAVDSNMPSGIAGASAPNTATRISASAPSACRRSRWRARSARRRRSIRP